MTNPLIGRHLLKSVSERNKTTQNEKKVFATSSKFNCIKCNEDHLIYNYPDLKKHVSSRT